MSESTVTKTDENSAEPQDYESMEEYVSALCAFGPHNLQKLAAVLFRYGPLWRANTEAAS
jgi:hypothetical protein